MMCSYPAQRSLLKSMRPCHGPTSDGIPLVMSPTAAINYRNNDTIVRNVTRHITIKDLLQNVVVRDFDAGAVNAEPLSEQSMMRSYLHIQLLLNRLSPVLVTVSL